jgi:glutamate/tyrosine decarboxylase-like PLP-dependent enzyme
MYRNEELLHYQFFTYVDWLGGIYASPTAAGSRPGMNSALTWATMLHYGRRGYERATKAIVDTTRKIRREYVLSVLRHTCPDWKMSTVCV